MNDIDRTIERLASIPDPVQARIAAFDLVRAIPYSTIGAHDPETAIASNKANCFAKSRLLALLLNGLGYETRFLLARYRLPDFPDEVRFIPGQADYHHMVEALIEGRWVLADPTYDPPLTALGFASPEWDGVHATPPAETPLALKVVGEEDKAFDREFAAFEKDVNEACRLHPVELEAYSAKFNAALEEYRANSQQATAKQ